MPVVPAELNRAYNIDHAVQATDQVDEDLRLTAPKPRPAIEEIPMIGAGLAVVAVSMAAASALLWTARGVLRLTVLDRDETTSRTA